MLSKDQDMHPMHWQPFCATDMKWRQSFTLEGLNDLYSQRNMLEAKALVVVCCVEDLICRVGHDWSGDRTRDQVHGSREWLIIWLGISTSFDFARCLVATVWFLLPVLNRQTGRWNRLLTGNNNTSIREQNTSGVRDGRMTSYFGHWCLRWNLVCHVGNALISSQFRSRFLPDRVIPVLVCNINGNFFKKI